MVVKCRIYSSSILVQMVWRRHGGGSVFCSLFVISNVDLISWLVLSYMFCGQWCVQFPLRLLTSLGSGGTAARVSSELVLIQGMENTFLFLN